MHSFNFLKSVKYNVPLKGYTTYKIGGSSDSLIEVYDTPSLIEVISRGGNRLILGKGSNVLVSDEGFKGLSIIVKTNNVRFEGNTVFADAGVSLSNLASRSIELSKKGLEFAAGIPGTVGGACIMNAGAFGSSMSNIIQSVDVLRDGKVLTLSANDCGFDYRCSGFKSTDVILSAVFQLLDGDKDELLGLKRQYALFRKNTQPSGLCAGSVFKKADKPAGFYIDNAGLKGFSLGNAYVSNIHANFIMNRGGASAHEVASLIDTVKAAVKVKFDVALKEEIKYIGF